MTVAHADYFYMDCSVPNEEAEDRQENDKEEREEEEAADGGGGGGEGECVGMMGRRNLMC